MKDAIHKKIKKIRESKGLSQYRLAINSGLCRSGLSQIEAGKVNPSLKSIVGLSKALGMTIDEIVNYKL